MCTSFCPSCGVLCEAFPITDLASATLYQQRRCTIISGDLYITNLPPNVPKAALLVRLATVRKINGYLIMAHNVFHPAMTFMKDVQSVYGVVYLNMPILIDARFHSLERMDNPVVSYEGCFRLCPERRTIVGPSLGDQSGCANNGVEFYLRVLGNATADDVQLLDDIIRRTQRNTTNWLVS